jgi:hypothetical protein
MASLLDVVLRAAKAENQEIAKTLFGSLHVIFRVHGAENVIMRDLAVKSGYKPLKPVFSDCGINFVVFQSAILAVPEFPSREGRADAANIDVQQIRTACGKGAFDSRAHFSQSRNILARAAEALHYEVVPSGS